MTESDDRGLQLLNWIDEHWQQYPNQRSMLAAANIQIRPVLTGQEQDWLAREWQARQGEREDATGASGAASGREGPAPPSDGDAGAGPDTDEEEVVDAETGEILDEDIPFEVDGAGRELEVAPRAQLVSLFGPGDADVALAQVEMYATRLLQFVRAHDLTLEMEDGGVYLLSPGWEALGQLTGTFATVIDTAQIPGGWKARAIARRQGEELTCRDAICTRAETGKKYKSENDLLATAETRACRNALRACLSIIVNAAGIDSTPLDERKASPRQIAALMVILEKLSRTPASKRTKPQWKDWVTDATLRRYGKRISGLTSGEIRLVIDGMQRMLEEAEGAGGEPDEGGWEPSDNDLAGAGFEFE